MPKKFDACVSGGGKVRTVKPKVNRYVRVCFPPGGGPSISAGVKKNKKK